MKPVPVPCIHCSFVKLSRTQKNCKYIQEGQKPGDEAHHTCPFCLHGYLDEPVLNKNLRLQKDHDALKKAFEDVKGKGKLWKKQHAGPKL